MSVADQLSTLETIRETHLIAPEKVLQIGANLLKNHAWSLGPDYWFVCEDLFYASLLCKSPKWTNVFRT